MNKVRIVGKLTNAEREVTLNYDSVDQQWYMDTTIMKFYNKAVKQGWKQICQYVYGDGSVCGGRFVAPARAVTIRNAEKKKMSDKQMSNLRDSEE